MGTYTQLQKKLEENKRWPLLYMFKFIVPNENGKIELVKSHLPQKGQLSYKHTKNLKYVSITCKEWMPSAESIVKVHSVVSTIEGVISL